MLQVHLFKVQIVTVVTDAVIVSPSRAWEEEVQIVCREADSTIELVRGGEASPILPENMLFTLWLFGKYQATMSYQKCQNIAHLIKVLPRSWLAEDTCRLCVHYGIDCWWAVGRNHCFACEAKGGKCSQDRVKEEVAKLARAQHHAAMVLNLRGPYDICPLHSELLAQLQGCICHHNEYGEALGIRAEINEELMEECKKRALSRHKMAKTAKWQADLLLAPSFLDDDNPRPSQHYHHSS